MDHRLGMRRLLILPVRLERQGKIIALGRTLDVSLSGAYVKTSPAFTLLTRVDFVCREHRPAAIDALRIAAFVTRVTAHGLAVEWFEFAPPVIHQLLALAESA